LKSPNVWKRLSTVTTSPQNASVRERPENRRCSAWWAMTRTNILSPATVSTHPSSRTRYQNGNIAATAKVETARPQKNTTSVTARYDAQVWRSSGRWPGRALPVCQVQKCWVQAGKRR
jgi:hypothetical protein